jgi:chromosome segregation ATPase
LEDNQSELKTSLDADITALRTKTGELDSILQSLQTSMKELQTASNDQQAKFDSENEAHIADYTELKNSIELQITRLDGYVNDIRDYIEDSMTKVDDFSHRTLNTEPGTRTKQSSSDVAALKESVLKQSELQMQEFMLKINTQLDEIRSTRRSHIPFEYDGFEKDLWMQRLDELEQRVQQQADELQATKELRDGVEQQLEEKTTALRKVERTLEATSELLKETKWENRGLRVTLSGMQEQQEQYRRSFQKLHDERLKGLLAAGSPTNMNSNNSVVSTLSSSTRGTAPVPPPGDLPNKTRS